jgi:transposase
MLKALGEGLASPGVLATMARGRLRDEIPQPEEALRGVMSDTQRWLPPEQRHKVSELDEAILRLDARIAPLCLPFGEALTLLDQIPGVSRRTAQVIVAEIGLDMCRFKASAPRASWAGLCPGNRESGGKQKSGRVRKGNRGLKAALVEAGWAVAHTKDTSLRTTYDRIAGRRGGKRACLAVAHRIPRMAWGLLRDRRPYREEGPDYYRLPDKDRVTDKLVRRLQKLGYTVAVTAAA